MEDIRSIEQLSEVIAAVANKAVEIATQQTTSGNYFIGYEHVKDLISEADYKRYFDLIETEVATHEEVLDLEIEDGELSINCGLAWCPYYDPLPDEDYDYGYEDFVPAPSLFELAKIGAKALENSVREQPLSVESLGISKQALDYTRATLLVDRSEWTNIQCLPRAMERDMEHEDILCSSTQGDFQGRRPALEWAIMNGVKNRELQEDHPEAMQKLDAAMEIPYEGAATRTACMLYGKPVILLSWDLADGNKDSLGPQWQNIQRAQAKMVAAQLTSALAYYDPHISSGRDPFTPESNCVYAYLSADTDPALMKRFMEHADSMLTRMPITRDINWVKGQYKAALEAISENQGLKNDYERTYGAVEACGSIGRFLGDRQYDWEKAVANHDSIRQQKILDRYDITKNEELLKEVAETGVMAAHFNRSRPVTLYLESLDSRVDPDYEGFTISKGNLLNILPKVGYSQDMDLTSFMRQYPFDVAKRVYELSTGRPPALKNQNLNDPANTGKSYLAGPQRPLSDKLQDAQDRAHQMPKQGRGPEQTPEH